MKEIEFPTAERARAATVVNGSVFLIVIALGGAVYLTPLKAWLDQGQLIKDELALFGIAAPLVFTAAAALSTAIGVIKSKGVYSVAQKMRELAFNVRLVFDYLKMTLNNHRLEAGGFELRTESPDTRRLNDASLLWLHPKIVVGIRLKMMFQILLDHLFRHLSDRGTEISPRPKMSPPIALLQMRKLLKQPTRRPSFDPPHDLTGRQFGRRTHQDVHVILAHHTPHYPDLKSLAGLAHQLSDTLGHVPRKNPIAIFRNPHKVVLNLKNRVAAISVVHLAPPCALSSQLKLTG